MIQLVRYKGNPILSPNPKNQWESKAVFNPGAVIKDRKIFLLYRAVGEYDTYISRLGLAISEDGFNFERVGGEPLIEPTADYDKWACEDPRITKIDDIYYITYVALSQKIREGGKPTYEIIHFLNSQTALLTTKDFVRFDHHGIITPKHSDNRDVVIFPQKVNGQFVMIHRPHRWCKNWFKNPLSKKVNVEMPIGYDDLPQRAATWVAYSNDLKSWHDHKLIIRCTDEMDEKTGAGAPPIKTDKGWLLFYHNVIKNDKDEIIYTTRAILLDLNNPSKVIAKIPYDILKPEADYEVKGDTDNVVFPTGAVVKDETIYIYYGAADKQCCLATIKLEEILDEFGEYPCML